MRNKRIMIIGPENSGKSTLANIINETDYPLKKSQDTIFKDNTIDVPSAYIQIPWMYKHAIALSQEAYLLIFIVDQTNVKEIYSPGFAQPFQCEKIGVITKSKKKIDNRKIAEKQLKSIGLKKPYFYIDINDGEKDIEILKNYLLDVKAKVK